jgi:epoxyqueuosine reductase
VAITAEQIKSLAGECGFELCGITPAVPHEDFTRFDDWRRAGMAGDMTYLTDHRGDLRSDPRNLLPEARTLVCLGKLYNTPYDRTAQDCHTGWISRYAWGSDYHEVLREALNSLGTRIATVHGEQFPWRACVDTAPLLERSYAKAAGLGWIGKNTCLINQQIGSWFFLAELLLPLDLTPDFPAPDRCGSCRRCIDSCPTGALVPDANGGWKLDARHCISYLTIEKRGPLAEDEAERLGHHLFGCDICQDVCPWNRRETFTTESRFEPATLPQSLLAWAELSEEHFAELFRKSPVWRTKYRGFLRNVTAAMANLGTPEMTSPLQRLAEHPDKTVAHAAEQALKRMSASKVS